MAKIYRGIVVVHGVGEHKKGSTVSGFVEELARFAGRLPGYQGRVELTARNRSDSSDTSWATIHIRNTDANKPDEEWHIREAWWTRTFQASQPGRVYLWAVLAGLALLWAACVQQFARGILAFWDKPRLSKWSSERVGRPFDRYSHEHLPESAQGIWLQPAASALKSLLDGLVWFVLTLLFVVVGLIGLLLIGLIYLVLVLPVSLFFPAFATRIVNALIKVIVFTLGDQEAMTTRQVALAAAANEVNTGLWNMLSAQGLASRRRQDPDFTGFETVTVVAHSGGCVVSMAALKSADLEQFRSEKATYRLGNQDIDFIRPKRVNWITAGSGLNLAWNVRFGNSPSNTALWTDRLSGINWLNLYARYDPVPQGPPPVDLVSAVIGDDPERNFLPPGPPPGPGVPPPPERPAFVGVRIANTDSPWADHGAYWSNHAEVISRVIHVVTDPRLANSAISPEQVDLGVKNLKDLDTALLAQIPGEVAKRRNRVTRKMVLLLIGLAVFAGAAAAWADDVGRWALGTDSFLGMDPWAPGGNKLENVVAKKFASLKIEAYRDRLIGLAVMAFVALLAIEYWRLFSWLWGFAGTRDTRRRKVLWFLASTTILLATLALLDLILIRWPTGALG